MAYQSIHGKLTKIRGKVTPNRYNQEYTKARSSQYEPKKELPGKGKYLGNCNRTACQAPGPTWWNTGSRSYYCGMCAEMINRDGCRKFNEPEICFKVTGFDKDAYPQ